MFKCSLINIYFLTTWILPGISNQTTRDAAKLWVRTTSNGDILVSLLSSIALFKENDWHFRQTVIRVCSISILFILLVFYIIITSSIHIISDLLLYISHHYLSLY